MQGIRLYGPVMPAGPPGAIPMNTSGAQRKSPLPLTITITDATEHQVMDPSFPSIPLSISIPANSPLEQQRFSLYASGLMTTPGAGSIAYVKFWLGNNAGAPGTNGNLLVGQAGFNALAGTHDWWTSFELIFDSTSGLLDGLYESFVHGGYQAKSPLSGSGIGGNIKNTNNPVAAFSMSVVFSTANPGNQLVLQEFAINTR
jgi:hypothetical protein